MKDRFCRIFFILSSFATIITAHKCHRNIETLWSTETGSSPIVSSPLLADINGDNVLDVAVTTFDGQVSVMNGQTGHVLPGWPFDDFKGTYHAAPLLYDVDKDGLNELLLCTSNGQILFIQLDGRILSEKNIFQIPPLKIEKEWYVAKPYQSIENDPKKKAFFAEYSEYAGNQEKGLPSGLSADGLYVFVDAHVLSTPVIADFNQDGLENELIIAVNYYFDESRVSSHPATSSLPTNVLEHYLGSSIVVLDLDTMDIVYKAVLEVTKRSNLYPGYVLSLPTVVDSNRVVIGTSAGNIYLIDSNHKQPKILTAMDSIQGQITVADVNEDGNHEILTVDDSGNVACINLDGKRVWESRISGSSAAGLRVADINGDSKNEVILASHDGYLWVLNGDDGRISQGWPVKLNSQVRSSVLVTKLQPGNGRGLDLVIPLLDGVLAIVRGTDQCTEFIQTGLSAFSSPVSAKMLPWKQGLELVIGCADGTVICLGDPTNATGRSNIIKEELFSWKAETKECSGTTFNSGKVGITFAKSSQNKEITGNTLPVEFEITDLQEKNLRWNNYKTKIFIGNKLLIFNKTLTLPGVHQTSIPIPPLSGKFLVIVRMVTPNEQCFQDSFHVSLNVHQMDDLQWYLMAPFLTMSCLLLVLHGHAPPQDVLPTFIKA